MLTSERSEIRARTVRYDGSNKSFSYEESLTRHPSDGKQKGMRLTFETRIYKMKMKFERKKKKQKKKSKLQFTSFII